MTSRRDVLLIWLVLPLLLFMSTDESHGGSGAGELVGKAVNFVILFGGLIFVLYKPLKAMLGKRAVDIQEDLAGANSRRGEAERKYAESTSRLSGLEEEIRLIKEEAEEEGRLEKERISRAAAAEAEKIKKYTDQEITELLRGGLQALKSFAVERATDIARERIRERLTEKDQAALIDKSIERLKKRYEKSGAR